MQADVIGASGIEPLELSVVAMASRNGRHSTVVPLAAAGADVLRTAGVLIGAARLCATPMASAFVTLFGSDMIAAGKRAISVVAAACTADVGACVVLALMLLELCNSAIESAAFFVCRETASLAVTMQRRHTACDLVFRILRWRSVVVASGARATE